MNDLKMFNNKQFGSVRTVEVNNKVYFCGTDVAKSLGYDGNPQDAIRRHCKKDGCVNHAVIDNKGRTQQAKFIDEGNLYRMIVHSKLPSAEKFERWVFDEVLPTIRKQGSYGFEDIQKIISLTVAETVKQLLPLMNQNVSAVETEEIVITRKRKRVPGTIERLPTELRKVVDEMICSDRYTYKDVVEMLADEGVQITAASVHRYAKRFF